LIGTGLATAFLGALMAFVQASLKRMLAFVVISHVGVFLAAIGLLTARGLAGATMYVIADGLVKGALFCAVGHLARRVGHTDELIAHGRGRSLRLTGAIVAVGALGLAIIPPLGTFASYSLVDNAAGELSYHWLPPLLAVATAVTGAAVLRAAGRIFLGLGPREDDLLVVAPRGEEEEEGERPAPRRGFLLWGPALALLVAGLGLAFAPGIANEATLSAAKAVDRAAVARETLHGIPPPHVYVAPHHTSAAAYAYGAASALAAVGLAWLGLYRRRVPGWLRAALDAAAGPLVQRLKLLHDGVVGEYVTWLTFGAAVFTGLLAVLTR
jgi:multicomponent Na+:H+ antiporter subunit D